MTILLQADESAASTSVSAVERIALTDVPAHSGLLPVYPQTNCGKPASQPILIPGSTGITSPEGRNADAGTLKGSVVEKRRLAAACPGSAFQHDQHIAHLKAMSDLFKVRPLV